MEHFRRVNVSTHVPLRCTRSPQTARLQQLKQKGSYLEIGQKRELHYDASCRKRRDGFNDNDTETQLCYVVSQSSLMG
jgi:hypothetical protein